MKKSKREMLQKAKAEDRKTTATEIATMVENLCSSDTGCLKLTESDNSDTEDQPFESVQQSNTQTVTNLRIKCKSASETFLQFLLLH